MDFISIIRFKSFDTTSEDGRSKERYRLIALSSSTNIIVKATTSLLGLITVPLTVNYLGKELFGLWMVLSSLVAWMQLSDFGIANGLINALSEAYGKDDKAAASSYIVTALISLIVIAIVLVFPLYIATQYIPFNAILNIENSSLLLTAKNCFFILGVFFLISVPVGIIRNIFKAFQLAYISNFFQILSSIINLIGIIIAVRLRLTLEQLLLVVSFAPLVGYVFSWVYFVKKFKWVSFRFNLLVLSALKRIAKTSIPLFFYQIGALCVNQLVNVVLANIAGLEMVADYNILLKIYLLIFFVGSSISMSFYPAIREAFERKEIKWVKNSIKRVLFLRIGILFVLSLPLLIIGDTIVFWWIRQPLGSLFGIYGWISFVGLLLLAALSSTLGEILIILDDIWAQILIVFISAIITVGGMILLVPNIGLPGVFTAFLISTFYPIFWGFSRLKKAEVV